MAGSNERTIMQPRGIAVNFDGGEVSGSARPHKAIEAKWGYAWMDNPRLTWTSKQNFAFDQASSQLPAQALISAICGVDYELRVSNLLARRGFPRNIPLTPLPYQLFAP